MLNIIVMYTVYGGQTEYRYHLFGKGGEADTNTCILYVSSGKDTNEYIIYYTLNILILKTGGGGGHTTFKIQMDRQTHT